MPQEYDLPSWLQSICKAGSAFRNNNSKYRCVGSKRMELHACACLRLDVSGRQQSTCGQSIKKGWRFLIASLENASNQVASHATYECAAYSASVPFLVFVFI